MVKSTSLTKKRTTVQKKNDIPVNIRWISISLFLFMIGRWLGGDTFFSIYVRSIVDSGLGLTLIGTLLAVIKLLVVIPVGVMNDQGNTRHLLLLGKMVYAVSGVFYFLAGMNADPVLLVIAVMLNGIASSMMFTTYRTVYGKKSQHKNRSKVFGIYFSSINMAYVIGALISAVLVSYIELPFMYLFIVIFALLSIIQDGKIQAFLSKRIAKSWKKRDKLSDTLEYEVNEDLDNVKKIMGKRWVLALFFKEVLSHNSWKKMFLALKSYGQPMHVALAAQSLVSLMNYVGFLFIPIIAIENNLSLPQIAILFAVMRLPYIINVFVGGFGDKYSKKILITIIILLSSIVYILFGRYDSFWGIVTLSFCSSLMIALLSPITAALITGYARPKDKGMMAGLQEFASRFWEIFGSLGFWFLASIVGMKMAFVILGVALAVLGTYLLSKKLIKIKTRDDEAKKELLAQKALT